MTSTQPTRRDGEATRQRLLRAALELYTTVGFRATTTPAIAARAGVAEGTIYRHFSGKEHLLNEVFRGRPAVGRHDRPGEQRGLRARPTRCSRSPGRLLETAARDAALTRMLLRHRDEQHLDEKSREAEREFRDALQHVVADGPDRRRGAVRADRALDGRMAGAGGVHRRAGRRPRLGPGRAAGGHGAGRGLGCDCGSVRGSRGASSR